MLRAETEGVVQVGSGCGEPTADDVSALQPSGAWVRVVQRPTAHTPRSDDLRVQLGRNTLVCARFRAALLLRDWLNTPGHLRHQPSPTRPTAGGSSGPLSHEHLRKSKHGPLPRRNKAILLRAPRSAPRRVR